jgi:hypothetical protein
LVTTCPVSFSASTAWADATRCGETVEDLQQLNDAIADFIARPACTHIELGEDILIREDVSGVQPIQPIVGGSFEAPELINRSLVIEGNGFTLTGESDIPGFVIYLAAPNTSHTLTIRNLGMSGLGGSGAVSVVSGATVIERSLFTNNTFQLASLIPGLEDASAGAINAIGGLVVTESQFEGNTGFEGGAIHNSPTLVPQLVPTGAALPPVQIIGSTFADNEASTAGGAIHALQPLAMSNSTATGNSGGSAGALNVDGTIFLDYCTIVENSSVSNRAAVSASGDIGITNSIVYGNPFDPIGLTDTFADVAADGTVVITSSLLTSSDSITSTLYATVLDDSNIVGEDPLLSPLGDYGGFTLPGGTAIRTRPPQIGSPIIDKIDFIAVGSEGEPTDQRGTGFSRFINGRADIGSVEFWPVPDTAMDPSDPVPDFDDRRWSLNLARQTPLPDTT